ncbi:unnamed protein product [Hymenolepis diminuta]|uniref:Chloride channel protein n=1 Tax=Hymenolepis diminuta TaxID=6216 RepID=A0A0R3STA3_HYMDI|nr:unnamed protein product [Hymenolepis diminuta]
MKENFQCKDICYRRLTNNFREIDSNGEYVSVQPAPRLSIYADAVIAEEVLDQKYESLEYDTPEVPAIKADMALSCRKNGLRNVCLRYVLLFAIGLAVGSVASLIDFLTHLICSNKYLLLQFLFDKYHTYWGVLVTGSVWCAINGLIILTAALLTVYVAPVAGGSGIPQIKCYLNGLNIPFVLRGKTMLIKALGVVLAVCGGLVVGKEGPMIHIGAVVAAGISQGRLTWCNFSSRLFRCFRNDPVKRDFVNAGAAAGVAAAFGAPVGGLLFTLEEGASFIFQRLTWNTLFTSVTSMFTLALFRSIIDGQPFSFTPGGLVSFGMFETATSYNAYELMIFVLMGVFGGLVGALFVALNKVTSKYRQSYMKSKAAKIIDAVLISVLTAVSSFAILILMADCRSGFQESSDSSHQILCADGEHNRVGSLLFTTPSKALYVLFHDPPNSFDEITLIVFIPYVFVIACITYGVSVPCGLFIPSLLLGAAWGRLIGDYLYAAFPATFPNPSKFALIGAAAQLGGIVRMIASLTVTLMEATGNVILGLPLLITLIPAKYIGDYFIEANVMTSPAIVLDPVMSVGDLHRLVFDHPHHAFPVVEGDKDPDNFNYGQLIGIYVAQDDSETSPHLTASDFDDAYPRFYKLKDVLLSVTDDEFERLLDFRPYMNPSPYSVSECMSMTRAFALFRLLGLRHLPVVDNNNRVRGIITRKDFCRFRIDPSGQVAELLFSRIY